MRSTCSFFFAIVVFAMAGSATGVVHAQAAPTGAFFLNQTSSTHSASLRIDGVGGKHVAAAGYITGLHPTDDPTSPAYYAYCPPSLDCADARNWSQVSLGQQVDAAQLELTPTGQPRLLLQTADRSANGRGYASYWYGECDADCLVADHWTWIDLVDTTIIDTTIWDETKHSFALDRQGRPRLVYGSGALVYTWCDAACTDVTVDPDTNQSRPANWSYTVIGRGLYWHQAALAFTSDGQPRLSAFVYEPESSTFSVDYLECLQACEDTNQWSRTTLMPQESAPQSVSLRVDGTDRIGIALGQSSNLWYWQCAADCAEITNWLWSRWDGLSGFTQDADLAFDAQNQPHMALRSTGGPFGWGLLHMWCIAECASAASTWTAEQVEDVSVLGRDLPLPLPSNCLYGEWVGGFRPSLALDARGVPSYAFDNQFWIGGCSDWSHLRTEFAAVRVVTPR